METNSLAPGIARTPSTSSISASVIASASASGSMPGIFNRRTESTARRPWMSGKNVLASMPN
jgi:hypothetical protein